MPRNVHDVSIYGDMCEGAIKVHSHQLNVKPIMWITIV